jgi:hypothetical protein
MEIILSFCIWLLFFWDKTIINKPFAGEKRKMTYAVKKASCSAYPNLDVGPTAHPAVKRLAVPTRISKEKWQTLSFCVFSMLNIFKPIISLGCHKCYFKLQIFPLFINYKLLSVCTRHCCTLGVKNILYLFIILRVYINIIGYLVTWQTSLIVALFLNFFKIQTLFFPSLWRNISKAFSW